jgi:hypothetical protein
MNVIGAVRDSHIAAACRLRENRLSAAVALGVAGIVALLSQIGLAPGFTVDLARPEPLWALRQATLVGFGEPGPGGRALRQPVARVIFNRPLPDRFRLALEGQALGGDARVPVEVRVGEWRGEHAFGPTPGETVLDVENPGRLRQIFLRVTGAPARLTVRRVAVR